MSPPPDETGDRAAAAPSVGDAVPHPLARRSRARWWLFRLLTLGLVALGFIGCEVSLRLVGVGDDDALVIPAPGHPQRLTHRLNPAIDQVYFGNRDLLGPEPRGFQRPKPPNTFRVIFLGASTVIGFPYAPEIAFPRQVEHLLEAQLPGVDVEVLNAGITAINSFEIADLARGCAAAEPDLVVIHTGHNEFYGPGGPGSTVLPVPPQVVGWTFQVRRLRLAQLLGKLVPTAPALDDPLRALPRLTGIRRTDREFQQATENYRHNLRASVATLRQAGVPVLLSTVASNLRHQGPIRNVWPAELTTEEQSAVESVLAQAAQLTNQGDAAQALELLAGVEPRAGEAAVFQFRKGEALARLQRFEEARAAFIAARDADGCRFRAPSDFAAIVRDLGEALHDPQVKLLDVETLVTESSLNGIPGDDLFLEHVHYNLRGHRLLGRLFARSILEQALSRTWDAGRDLSDVRLDELLGLEAEDAIAGLSFALQTVQTPPLAQAVDSGRVETRLQAEIEQLYTALPAGRQERFADLSMHDMQQDLVAALTRRALALGDVSAATEQALRLTRRKPWSSEAWLLLAQVRRAAGDLAGAREACHTARGLNPADAGASELEGSLNRP